MEAIKGGRITTTSANQELIVNYDYLKKVSIYNQSDKEITVMINHGNEIPIGVDESIKLGNLKVVSIIIIEKGSTVKYIGI